MRPRCLPLPVATPALGGPLGYKLAMTLSGADRQRELARTAERGTQRRGAEQRAEGGDDKGAESRARNKAGMLYRS